MKHENRDILSIDLKSFYASVECLNRGLDPFQTPLVVADESRGDGTIVLAASPFIKERYKVPSRCRLYEVPKDIPGLIIACPNMEQYLEVSALINGIYLDYVSENDLHIYSIDESFLDVTHYMKMHNDTPITYARKIISEIRDKTGLTVTAGIGKNIFMAKACMDIEAKHKKDFLSSWDYEDIPTHLWPVAPLSKMWGIGNRLEKRLNRMGFYTIGDIAVSDKNYLRNELGVIGEEIYEHSHGYDDALIQEPYESNNHSLSVGQVLLRDYAPSEIPTVINDMAYELSERMIEEEVSANAFSFYIGISQGSGIAKKILFLTPTDSGMKMARKMIDFYLEERIDPSIRIRQVFLVAHDVKSRYSYQMSLFGDEEEDEKLRNLEMTMIDIRKRYGVKKAMPLSALSLSSTFLNRSEQIGGHHR